MSIASDAFDNFFERERRRMEESAQGLPGEKNA
jgi:hypothetical protein